ncbi:MAG TPA: 2Fe-2S iron-sulfur cluster-binding protein [Xanthobacteraceae bacterium]|nr:2Fe-2S iron-sulfur cluster-binding protein [Xanthobacteraceae bacterium]
MPKITYIDPDGETYVVEAEIGATVMETAMRNDVPGIIASCGGSCACATCHVHVDAAWLPRVGERSLEEEDMLDSAVDVDATSRLSCQIKVVEELDGLKVTIAARQI